MARRRPNDDQEDRQRLIELAGRIRPGAGQLVVLIARGEVEIVQPAPPIARPGQVPEGMRPYDAAILTACTDNAVSSQRLARAAGHRHNSYFRERLAALVEAGHIQHTRRGYRLPVR